MNIILKISGIIFPLITFPYVSRVLLSEANGKIAFAASVVSYFSLLASLGIPSYGIRKCAEVRDDEEQLSKVVTELLILNSICTVVSYLVFIVLILTVPQFSNEFLLFSISSLTILFNMLGVEWFYQAIEQYQYITVRNITFKIISILLMFLLVHNPSDYIVYAGINVLASVGSNLLNALRLPNYVKFGIANQKYNLSIHLLPILTLFLYNATTIIFTSLDQVMLGFMKGNVEVGYYATSIKVQNILVSFITALGAVMLPKISYSLKNEGMEHFDRMIRKSFEFILVSAIPICFLILLLAKEIILILAGEDYLPAVPILQFLAPSLIFIGLSSVTAWQLLIPLGKQRYTVIGALAGMIVNLCINFLAIPVYGGVGAAFASSLAECAVLLVHFRVLKEIINRTFEMKEFMISLLSTFVASAILLVTKYFFAINVVLLAAVVYSMIFLIVYIVMLILCRERLMSEVLQNVRVRMNKRGI
ncbi:flippase [Streptococcus danieliae]|nr:flippase [Streptococcus danieliae]